MEFVLMLLKAKKEELLDENVDPANLAKFMAQEFMIEQLSTAITELTFNRYDRPHLEETVRIYKASDEIVREQAKKVKHLFPLENTAGYGQLCDLVVKLSKENAEMKEIVNHCVCGDFDRDQYKE